VTLEVGTKFNPQSDPQWDKIAGFSLIGREKTAPNSLVLLFALHIGRKSVSALIGTVER
jgi:hypothetical protein